MNVGDAATKFVSPQVHMRTYQTLTRNMSRYINAGPPFPASVKPVGLRNLNPGRTRITITEDMGFNTGRGYYSPAGAATNGTTAGAQTPMATRATAVYQYMGRDAAGNPILRLITLYPEL